MFAVPSSPPTGNKPQSPAWVPTKATTLKFVTGYVAIGLLWVILSDWTLHDLVPDRERETLIDALKDSLFVLTTAVLVGQILGRYFKAIASSARLLQESESRLRFISDNLPSCYLFQFVRDAEGAPHFTLVSAEVERIHGVSAQKVMEDAKSLISQIDPEQVPSYLQAVTESGQNLTDFDMELHLRRPDGEWRYIHLRSRPQREGEGRVRWDGVAFDITEHRRAEEALQQSESLMREMEQTARIGGWDLDPVSGKGDWTEEVIRIHDLELGVDPHVEMGLSFFHGEARTRIENALREACEKGTPYDLELPLISAKGVPKWVRTICRPVIKNGMVVRLHGSLQDITDYKQASEAMEAYRAKLEAALESMTDAVLIVDREGKVIEVNPAFNSFVRLDSKDLYPKDLSQFLASIELLDGVDGENARNEVPFEEWPISKALRGEKGANVEYTLRRKDTGQEWMGSFSSAPIRDQNGAIVGAVSVGHEITAMRKALAAAQESEANFRSIFELASIGMGQADPVSMRFLRVNKKLCEITGYSERELLGMSVAEITHLDDRKLDRQNFEQVLSGKIPDMRWEKRYIRKDGDVVLVNVNMSVIRDKAGVPLRMMAAIEDITESRRLEEQLRQSQRMEAIGQLAGGVAHDFNNILCMIRIETELAESAENIPENIREDLHQIRAAADRAADLTRQLLLFSRKQVMQRRTLDLNEAVANIAKMLERIIGEDVTLELKLSPAALFTNADPGMLDQILINLAVNSRDAMPEGGTLSLETAEKHFDSYSVRLCPGATSGRYVCLSVSDTGYGMSPEVKNRIFEPFFTTKGPGKGTGLGLATVFGIVKQHLGWVVVDSVVGKGTTFQVFLPACKGVSGPSEVAVISPPVLGGNEIILLAEDDSSIRFGASLVLERHGYKVLVASDGLRALDLWDQHHEEISLLVTDLVMPGGMSGTQLAARLQKDRTKLKVVYVSGYSPDIAGTQLGLKRGEEFLQKPFSTEQLLKTVRKALDC